MQDMQKDIESILADEAKLAEICDRLAARITEDYRESDRDLVFVIILKGSVYFATDLIRRIPLRCEMEFMKVSSYGASTTTSGFIQVHLDLKRDVQGADVIVIEDIIDSGRTLEKLSHLLADRGAHSVRFCTLLDKPARRIPELDIHADYTGFTIENEFVVGYGLDYKEVYRNLPFIGVLKPEVYENKGAKL